MYKNERKQLINMLKKNTSKTVISGDFGIGKSTMIEKCLKDESLKGQKVKFIDAKIHNDPREIINIAESTGYWKNKGLAGQEIKVGITSKIFGFLSFQHSKHSFLRSWKFFLPLLTIIFSLISIGLSENSKSPNLWKSLAPLLVLMIIFLLASPIIEIIKRIHSTTSRKANIIVVIDNLDRIDYQAFEQIVTHNFKKNKKIIMVFDLGNIALRYKERFNDTLLEPFKLLEKYTPDIINLQFSATQQLPVFFNECKSSFQDKKELKNKLQEVLLSYEAIQNTMTKYKIINLRLLSKIHEQILENIVAITQLNIDIFTYFMINLNQIVNPVMNSDLIRLNSFGYTTIYKNESKQEHHSERVAMQQIDDEYEDESLYKIWKEYENSHFEIALLKIALSDLVEIKIDRPEIFPTYQNIELFLNANALTERLVQIQSNDNDSLNSPINPSE